MGLSSVAFITLRDVPSNSHFFESFYFKKDVGFCQMPFLNPVRDYLIFSLRFVYVAYHIN